MEINATYNDAWSCGQCFFDCYSFFARLSLVQTVFELSLGAGIVVANMATFLLIYFRSVPKTVFDNILMAHALVELVIGLFDLPFYHVMTIFGYWPFGKLACILWSILDNSVNTVAILHMAFLQYARVQSIAKPNSYLHNRLIRNSVSVCACVWFLSLAIWVSEIWKPFNSRLDTDHESRF